MPAEGTGASTDDRSAANTGDLSRMLTRLEDLQRLAVQLGLRDVATRAAGLRFLLERIHGTDVSGQPRRLPRETDAR